MAKATINDFSTAPHSNHHHHSHKPNEVIESDSLLDEFVDEQEISLMDKM